MAKPSSPEQAAALAARLREVLIYNPETGEFVWRVTRCGRALAGSVAGTLDRGKYRARIFINRKCVSLGYHETLEAAAAAVREAGKSAYGEFYHAG